MTGTPATTAVLLIGYQNDYLSEGGALNEVIEENVQESGMLDRTLSLIDALKESDIPVINTPILFSSDYSELKEPQGLMQTIKEVGAFQRGKWGGETIPQLLEYGDRITHMPGKTWFNSFQGTNLKEFLDEKNIKTLVVAGVVTSLCIDSTARAAADLGYETIILSDCTGSRTMAEQDFYCSSIFTLYAKTITTDELLEQLTLSVPA
ncbi:MAG: cysteine hydrolase [Rhodothermaceae bacterium]|nr:cysteine hydrolase [Rhodothermaceae bacterium]